jgi:hypothetical protein
VTTDCRSDDGITVGLVDSLITTARVLARRNLTSDAVREALYDLADNEDMKAVIETARASARGRPPTLASDH